MSHLRLLFDDVEVTKDGLTYIIERTHREQSISMVMREDSDGWLMKSSGGADVVHRLGRRKSWIKALHDALVWIDALLESREAA